MNKVLLEDKLFHGVKPYNKRFFGGEEAYKKEDEERYKLTKLKLHSIFETGFIMCRENIKKANNPSITVSKLNYNGPSYISLSRDISQKPTDSSDAWYVFDDENAYIDYPFNYPSIVFDQSILESNPEVKYGGGILLELQVQGDINLKQAVAVSMPSRNSLDPFFCDDADILESLEDYKRDSYNYLILKYIKCLLDSKHSSLPIISIRSGNIYRQNKEYEDAIKTFEKTR